MIFNGSILVCFFSKKTSQIKFNKNKKHAAAYMMQGE